MSEPKPPKPNQKAPTKPVSSTAMLVAAWISCVALVGILALCIVFVAHARRWYLADELLRANAEAEQAREAPRDVEVLFACSATIRAFECAFTNNTDENAAPLCVNGLIVRKADNTSLKSMLLCSGTVPRRTSKVVETHWHHSSPDELCFKKTSWGQSLDWSQCEFTAKVE